MADTRTGAETYIILYHMKKLLVSLNIVRKWGKSFFEAESIVTALFHQRYYRIGEKTTFNTFWGGVKTLKCPLDMWIYQEILSDRRPDVIIECGTKYGGSAYFFSTVFDMIKSGRVITIDIEDFPGKPAHDRITYVSGSSISPEILEKVKAAIRPGEKIMVILDSNHRRDHVFRELELYAPMVTQGQYMVVEDTNINGHPARPSYGPGPMEAVRTYMSGRTDFSPDRSREKFMLTYNPEGYWIKK